MVYFKKLICNYGLYLEYRDSQMKSLVKISILSFCCSTSVHAGFYINFGDGVAFSNSSSSFTKNSSSALYSPTIPGTSLFTLTNVNWNNDFGNGYNINAALGYRFNEHWRTDIEFLYQNIQHSTYGTYGWLEQNSSTGATFSQQPNDPISKANNRANIYSFLTNAAYDFRTNSKWIPLLSGGFGFAWINSD